MQTLEDIVGSRVNIAILRHLSAIRGGLSGNELAGRLRLRESSVRQALQRLVAAGIVTRADVGNSAAYELDRELVFHDALLAPLFRAEMQLHDNLIEALRQAIPQLTPRPRAVVLFGSLARGARDFRDIDLLCIAATARDKELLRDALASGFETVERRYKTPVSAVVATEADLRTERLKSVLKAAQGEGILLWGKPPAALSMVRTA